MYRQIRDVIENRTHFRSAFTLAEVLITLGIIGVVAAMSIPTLIANTNSAKFRSQFKKTMATLNQAVLMSQAQYDFDFAGVTEESDTTNLDAKKTPSISAMMMSTLAGATIYGSDGLADAGGTAGGYSETWGGANMYILLADGAIFGFDGKSTQCSAEPGTTPYAFTRPHGGHGSRHCLGFIDVNGVALPNKQVVCKDGETADYDGDDDCVVPNDAAHMGDIFPVWYHDGVIEPRTNAGRYVLSTAK